MGILTEIAFFAFMLGLCIIYLLASLRVIFYGEVGEPRTRFERFTLVVMRLLQRQVLLDLTQLQLARTMAPIFFVVLLFTILLLTLAIAFPGET